MNRVYRMATALVFGMSVGLAASAGNAESRASASALIYRISIDPKAHPRLSWSWKIARTTSPDHVRRRFALL